MTKDEIFASILSREGGYVDHPDDRGGPTHWGITLTTARANGYMGDMRNLTRNQALKILRQIIGMVHDLIRLPLSLTLSQLSFVILV